MQYPVAKISQFHCALCEETDNSCQRQCLCIITLDVIFGSQRSPMLSDIKGVWAVLGSSSPFTPAFMPEPGCLSVDQNPVALKHRVNTKSFSCSRTTYQDVYGASHQPCSNSVQSCSAAKEALQKMRESSAQGHPTKSGINLGSFLSAGFPCPRKETTAILNDPYEEGSIKAGSPPVSPCPSSSCTLRHISISQSMKFLSLGWVINIDIPINK